MLLFKSVTTPRCFSCFADGIAQESKMVLHGFGDAFPKAHGGGGRSRQAKSCNRRGLCHIVWSVNAKIFKTASKEIQKFYDETSPHKVKRCGIRWIKIESILDSRRKGLRIISSRNVHRGERDGGNDPWKGTFHFS